VAEEQLAKGTDTEEITIQLRSIVNRHRPKALTAASQGGFGDIVTLLLEHGADAKQVFPDGDFI